MPAPYRIADVRETNATYHRTFEGKICNLVSNPRVTMAISQKKLALTTRPSCPLKISADAGAIWNRGRD